MSQFYVEENEEEEVFKVIVIGDSNVGKSCLAHRFCKGTFPERTEATIGVDFWEKQLTVGQRNIRLQLWDTAGQERFRKSMVGHYYRNVSAVVFMYDVTREGSFQALAMWFQEYSHFGYTPSGHGHVPKILIGNKCDLTDERRVGSTLARKFADQHDMPLWEISTKNDEELETINSIFLTLAHKLVKHKPLMEQNSLYMSMGHFGEETPSRTIQRKQKSTKRIKLKSRGASVNDEQKKACCTESTRERSS